MKVFGILTIFLTIIGLSACDDNDAQQDKVETIKILVSSETGTYTPWGSDVSVDCMLIKEGNETEYKVLQLSGIINFTYEKGYEYVLIVEKTILANPPSDGSNVEYKLIEVLSKR